MTLSLIILLSLLPIASLLCLIFTLYRLRTHRGSQQLDQRITELKGQMQATHVVLQQAQKSTHELLGAHQQDLHRHRKDFDQHHHQAMQTLQKGFTQSMSEIREQISHHLELHTNRLNQCFDTLNQKTQHQLSEISKKVDERLAQGFEKTTQTFQNIIERLAMIDQAQQKITELSSHVVSLQDVLTDKQSRGAFGEVQLTHLLQNALPNTAYHLQHTLSNGKRVDCLLRLPNPTGDMAIDAKFPLESYQRLMQSRPLNVEHKKLVSTFKADIKKHITDIYSKYIIRGETADSAVLFLPAESIFAEIHSHHRDLVEYAHQHRVWLVSPSTMMAVLTTCSAVLKDAETREQIHLIQHHLHHLSKDFSRFRTRMNDLARHIAQAHQDVEKVQTSSEKITNRFNKIEAVELTEAICSVSQQRTIPEEFNDQA